MNYNKVILVGHLTRDPELRTTQGGTQVGKAGLAINRGEEVCFVDFTAFKRQAEVLCEFLKRGDPVLIEGRLEFQQWESKEGEKKSKLAVIADRVELFPKGSPKQEQFDRPSKDEQQRADAEKARLRAQGQQQYRTQDERKTAAQSQNPDDWGRGSDNERSDIPF